MTEQYLTTAALAEQLHIPAETLRYWRHVGAGPRSFKLGRRVLYAEADVQAWIDAERAAQAG